MYRHLILFFIFAALILNCAPKENQFNLVDRDTPCTIVLELGDFKTVQEANAARDTIDWFDNDFRNDEICRQALAALELQKHLSLILDVPLSHLPIVDIEKTPASGNLIFLGAPQHPNFKKIKNRVKRFWRKHKQVAEQDFRVDSFFSQTHQGLVLSGRSSTAILYAAYELLTRWGVRWYSPDQQGDFIPHYPNIGIYNMHFYVRPSFKMRGFWMDAQRTDAMADSLFIVWMGRNRLNLFSNTQGNIGALKQRGFWLNTGRQDLFSALLKPEYQYRYNHPTFQGDDQYPMDPYMVSEMFKGDTDADQKLSYAEAHPEWFGVEEDKSDHQHVALDFAHLCLSQTAAVEEFSQTVIDKLCYGDWKNCDIIDLWTPEIWCSCTKCQQMGNDADKLLFLIYHVNKTIEKARKDEKLFRQIYVHGYARNSALNPPSVSLPNDFHTETTAVFLFTGPRCFNHVIIDPQCTDINIWFVKNLWAWLDKKKVYNGELNIAENYNADYCHNLPIVHSNIMAIDIPAYAEIGVKSLSFQHVRMRDIGVQRLTNYQFARQSWDAKISTDTLKQEFFNLHYPGLADLASKYYERIELAMSTVTTWRYYLPQRAYTALNDVANAGAGALTMNERFVVQKADIPVNFNTLWENTYHLIFEARYLMDELLAQEMPSAVRPRVEELDEQLRYAELMVNVYDNIVSFITQSNEEQYIKDEAILRLVENRDKLAAFKIQSPIFGVTNALEMSGVKELIEYLEGIRP